MLICLDLHALGFMPCFPMFCASFCSRLMLGLHAHMFVLCCWLRLARIYVFMCLFPLYMVGSLSSHAYMLGFMFFHVYVLGSYVFTCMFLCLYVQIYVFTCLCSWIYVLYRLYVIFHVLVCSMPCLCAQTQAMFVMPCAIVAFLSLYLSFLSFGLWLAPDLDLMVFVIVYTPRPTSKWFGSFLFCMSMLACFYALCLCQPLLFQALPRLAPLAGSWLCGYI